MGHLNIEHTSLQGISLQGDAFIVIIATEWNAEFVSKLLAGSKQVLDEANVEFEVVTVPGAVEIPFAIASNYRNTTRKADAYIAFGCVIKGDTPHFDYVCNIVSDSITQLNIQQDVPTIFGVLTVLTEAQALERLGGVHGHKGKESAVAAVKMIMLNRKNYMS